MFVFNVEEVGSYLQFLPMRERENNYKREQKVVRHTHTHTIIKRMGRQRNRIYIQKKRKCMLKV